MTMMVTTALIFCLGTVSPGKWALQDGTKVSVVFVQPSQKLAWRPDGSAFDLSSLPKPSVPIWSAKETDPVIVALTNPAISNGGAPSVLFKLPATSALESTFSTKCLKKSIWISGYRVGAGQPSEQDIAVGVADGMWNVVGTIAYTLSNGILHATKQSGLTFTLELTGSRTSFAMRPVTILSVPSVKGLGGDLARYVVFGKDGKEYPSSTSAVSLDRKGYTDYTFQGFFQKVSRVELQTRKVEWHTIRVAHFKAPVDSKVAPVIDSSGD